MVRGSAKPYTLSAWIQFCSVLTTAAFDVYFCPCCFFCCSRQMQSSVVRLSDIYPVLMESFLSSLKLGWRLVSFAGSLGFICSIYYWFEVTKVRSEVVMMGLLFFRYVRVDEIEIFYYFIESEGNPRMGSIMIWHSGGPGCSALNGLINQIGILCLLISFMYVGREESIAIKSWYSIF